MERSAMEMTITNENQNDLDEEIAKLRHEIMMQRERNDTLRQELYEVKRTESFYKNVNSDARGQVEALQKELVQTRINRKQQREAQHAQKINPLKSKVLSLQQEIDELQCTSSAEIDQLRQRLADLKLTKQGMLDSSECASIDYEAQILKEIEDLKLSIIENKENLEEKSEEREGLEKKKVSLLVLLEETRESLESATSDLNSANNNLKVLNESTAQLESELNELKSQPQAEGTRGNCLFGQVDDKRLAVIEKTKQVIQIYQDTLQSLARSSSQLKQLRIDHIGMIEELKKTNVKEVKLDQSLLSKIQNLELQYEEMERSIKEVPFVADPSLKGANLRFVNFMINTPGENLKEARKEMNNCSAKQLKIAEELYLKQIELINIRTALLLEEFKQQLVSDQIEDYKKSESVLTLTQESCEEETSEGEKKSEVDENDSEKSQQVSVEACPGREQSSAGLRPLYKPNKGRKSPLKFECKQKVINLSDFDD